MSDNLNIPDIASGQANKYLLANEQKAALDAAITDLMEIDTSGGPASISDEDYQRHVLFRVSGGNEEVTLPAIRRMVAVEASGTACTLVRGSTSVSLASGDIGLVYTDGSSDGLVQVGSTGGSENLGALATFDMSGGADGQYVASDGSGGVELRDIPESGIEEAPQNGSGYERKDGAWAEAPWQNENSSRLVSNKTAIAQNFSSETSGKASVIRANRLDGTIAALVSGSAASLFCHEQGTRFSIAHASRSILEGSDFITTQVLTSDGEGNIGIGTNNPSERLEVAGPVVFGKYTVATLPSSPGEAAQAYATDGRKAGESSGSGTGVPVYYSGGWKAFGTDQAVEA